MLNNIPYVRAKVCNKYIKGKEGTTDCYIIAVSTLLNRPHLFTIHTIDGAVYARLPISAFRHDNIDLIKDLTGVYNSILDEYGVISEKSQVIKIDYLKDYEPYVIDLKTTGRYIFSIEPVEGAFAEDPEQSKLIHFIELKNGYFGLFPNNKLRFTDNYFTEPSGDSYVRNTKYFTIE
jgi:hypothetical protein